MNLQILPRRQRALWGKLAGVKPKTGSFYLAGGTAAALHLEHRESIDFDFFHDSTFNTEAIVTTLSKLGRLSVESQEKDTLLAMLSGVKISYFTYPYPLLQEPTLCEGIKVASLEDIAAMKVIAIGQRGAKKDFVDIHALLEEGWNLPSIFRCVERKFEDREYNRVHLLKSLTYFKDAEEEPMPVMRTKITWAQIKQDLQDAARGLVGF